MCYRAAQLSVQRCAMRCRLCSTDTRAVPTIEARASSRLLVAPGVLAPLCSTAWCPAWREHSWRLLQLHQFPVLRQLQKGMAVHPSCAAQRAGDTGGIRG